MSKLTPYLQVFTSRRIATVTLLGCGSYVELNPVRAKMVVEFQLKSPVSFKTIPQVVSK